MSIFNGLEYVDKANQAPETVIDRGSNDLTEVLEVWILQCKD